MWEVEKKVCTFPERYALKKVLYAFRNGSDSQRTYRELCYLLHFGHHDNILEVHDVLVSANDRHLYIVTDLMDSDLQKAMRCQCLSDMHKKLVAYQVLRALKYVHSVGVMHRDVKPSNVLINTDCKAVLCDFGWARSTPMNEGQEDLECGMTEYASTRWYRAPEMLLGCRCYTTAVDIWAYACMVAEIHLETPMMAGTSTLDMLTKIEEMLGKPLAYDMEAMQAPFASMSRGCMLDGPPHIPIDAMFPPSEELLVDFLKLMLQYNPQKRMAAEEALTHPHLGSFHDPDGEPACVTVPKLSIHDDQMPPASRYRDQIYAEALGLEAAKERLQDEMREQAAQDSRDSLRSSSKMSAVIAV